MNEASAKSRAGIRRGIHISLPVSLELSDQAGLIEDFRRNRHATDRELAACPDIPSAALLEKICDCLKSPIRRIPLAGDERIRAGAVLESLKQARTTHDALAYSRHFAAAALYLVFPQIGLPRPELLQPWIAKIISAGSVWYRGCLVGVSDDEDATARTMRWCIDFARSMAEAQKAGKLTGGEEAWNRQWLRALGIDISAINFYSSAASMKEFAETFGRLRAQAFAANPPLAEGLQPQIIGDIPARRPGDKRWRIALFCSCMYNIGHGLPHIIWWLKCLDREKFEPVLVLRYNKENERATLECLQRYPKLAREAPIILTTDDNLEEVKKFDFDLLYTFDDLCLGNNERPAYTRLARKQVTAFYTPATTGCPKMDYFITSPDLNPKIEGEFTEQVVFSEGLPFCCHFASYFGIKPLRGWRDDDIPQDAIVYTMGSSMLTKVRPEFVDTLMEILRRVPNAICVAMPSTRPRDRIHMTAYFARKCGEAGISPERIRFYAVNGRSLLHGLISCSDVFLDYFPFSGTNNVLDPLTVGTPCVTLRSTDFSRGRIAAAILSSMGLDDLVADSKAEYIDLAVKLGTDHAFRKSIKARLGAGVVENSPVCDGPAFVARMEKALETILHDKPPPAAAKTGPDKPAVKAELDREYGDFNCPAAPLEADTLMRDFMFECFRPYLPASPRGEALAVGLQNPRETVLAARHFENQLILNGEGRAIERLAVEGVDFSFDLAFGSSEKLAGYGRFDAIFSIHTFNSIERPDVLLERMRESLNDGGKVFIAVQNAASGSRRMGVSMGFLPDIYEIPAVARQYGQARFLDLEGLRDLVKKTGFRELDSGGILFKTVTDAQLAALIRQRLLGEKDLRALFELGKHYPQLCASVYVVAEKV